MRVQVYNEELGEGVEVIRQTSRQGKEFIGLRVWLKSPKEILEHSTPEDDDRSAVTFWFDDLNEVYAFVGSCQAATLGINNPT